MTDGKLDFDTIWAQYVVPLRGKTVRGMDGLENEILRVDGRGVTRASRNDLVSRIPIEPFRWAVTRVLAGHEVERVEINAGFPHRYSSGVFLVLEQVPVFEAFKKSSRGKPKALRLRRHGDR
jgi:restriction system protein